MLNDYVNKNSINLVLCFLLFVINVDAQQININRIEQMPNIPYPYEMRDWKKVTSGYDSLVFDLN